MDVAVFVLAALGVAALWRIGTRIDELTRVIRHLADV